MDGAFLNIDAVKTNLQDKTVIKKIRYRRPGSRTKTMFNVEPLSFTLGRECKPL